MGNFIEIATNGRDVLEGWSSRLQIFFGIIAFWLNKLASGWVFNRKTPPGQQGCPKNAEHFV